MNNKHISCGIVALFIVLLIQLTLWVQGNRTKVQKEAEAAQQAETAASTQLNLEKAQLQTLRKQSEELIEFLKIWQPQFDVINTAQSAEVNFSMQVRESGLVNLEQSFKQEAVKGNASIPSMLRAQLVFEDDYVRLLNWLGKLETVLPTMRVSNVHISKGLRAGDIRMETTLEQPLIAK